MSDVRASALLIQGPREALLDPLLVPAPQSGQVRVATERSGISAGTELLFYRGEIPTGTVVDECLPHLAQPVSWPLRRVA